MVARRQVPGGRIVLAGHEDKPGPRVDCQDLAAAFIPAGVSQPHIHQYGGDIVAAFGYDEPAMVSSGKDPGGIQSKPPMGSQKQGRVTAAAGLSIPGKVIEERGLRDATPEQVINQVASFAGRGAGQGRRLQKHCRLSAESGKNIVVTMGYPARHAPDRSVVFMLQQQVLKMVWQKLYVIDLHSTFPGDIDSRSHPASAKAYHIA